MTVSLSRAETSSSCQRSMPTDVTVPIPSMFEPGAEPLIVHVGTSPRNNATYGRLADGLLSKPRVALCWGVKIEHGSTPSNRTSRGRCGAAEALLGTAGASRSGAVAHPATATAATRSSTVRTERR